MLCVVQGLIAIKSEKDQLDAKIATKIANDKHPFNMADLRSAMRVIQHKRDRSEDDDYSSTEEADEALDEEDDLSDMDDDDL